MSVVYNPLSGNFETKEPGPQGPAGTVSAAGDGSQGTPSISFASDTNTGLYRYAENSIGVSTGGATRIIVNSSGNLLMGSSISMHPDADDVNIAGPGNVGLTFRCPTNAQGAIYFADGVNGHDRQRGMIVYDHTDNSLRLHANVGERMRLTSDGKLGLGTSSPDDKLNVLGGIRTTGATSNANVNGALLDWNSATRLFAYAPGGAPILFYTNSSGGNVSERMRLTADGRVGIGTSSPIVKLQIQDSSSAATRIWSTDTQSFGQLQLQSSSQFLIGYGSAHATQPNEISLKNIVGDITFYTGGSERVRIDANGDAEFAGKLKLTDERIDSNYRSGNSTTRNLIQIFEGSASDQATSPSVAITNDGSATFDGKVETNSFVSVLGPTGGNSIQVRKAPYTSSDNTAIIKTDGSASFASDITIAGGTATAAGVDIESDGQFRLRNDSITSTSAAFIVYRGGTAANDAVVRFNYDGSATFAGSVSIGGTAAANTIDEYEEGTWTPSLEFGGATTGITYNARAGFYVKVGKVIHVWLYFNLSNKGSATGTATVAGLPFTSEDFNINALTSWPGSKPSRRQNEFSSDFAMAVLENNSEVGITNGAGSAVTDSSFSNGTIIECALCYRAA